MANKVYQVRETGITWLSSTGTNVITLTSLGAGAGRQGAHDDLLATARATRYEWRAWIQWAATPVVGDTCRIYLKTALASDSRPDNDDGTGDIAVSAADKLRNLHFLGVIVCDQAAADIETVASGIIDIPYQVVAPVFWNDSAAVLTATALEHGFQLTPVPPEIA